MDVYLHGKRVKLDPRRSLGKGGEADVYRLGDGRALKVWKAPDHPDYDGLPAEQRAAAARLEAHQQKLRAFPAGLPVRVVAPGALATDRAGDRIVGYAMELVERAEPLFRYADPAFRRAGVPGDAVLRLFRDLHRTVLGLHAAGVVIGDFNDLNVLVTPGEEARLIDADSFQFGAFACAVFTERFVDPLLCDPAAPAVRLVRPHGPASDWYAFAALLMQSLLLVGPYGGVHRPADPARRVAPGARPLRRLTVFHPEVVYPRPATRWEVLPDDLLHHLTAVFERDERRPFPPALLDAAFARCPRCGVEHARASCPLCSPGAASRPAQTVTVRGAVTCASAFETRGVIVHAATERGALRLVHHQDGAYRREDGSVVQRGPLDPALRFRTLGAATLLGRGAELALVAPGHAPVRLAVDAGGAGPAFDANGRHHYRAVAGRLVRGGAIGGPATLDPAEETVGEVLEGQTRLWVGPAFGLGLYRAGGFSVLFAFDAERRGVNDSLRLPAGSGGRGALVDARCSLDEGRAWLLLAVRQGGKLLHRCHAYGRRATGIALLGTAEAEAGDGSWLGTIGGHCAAGGVLLAPTDEGLQRIEVEPGGGPPRVTRRFPDTASFLDAGCQLLAGREGLLVVRGRTVSTLRLH